MTVYFMGTETEDFPTRLGALGHNTGSSNRRSTNVRAVLVLTGGTEDATYMETDAFSATDFWTHITHGCFSSASATSNLIKWYSGGTQKLAFRWSNTTGTLELRQWNGASWTSLGTATDINLFYVNSGYPTLLDFYIKLGNPGEFRVYYNNMPAISLNALDLSSISSIDKIRLQACTTNSSNYSYYSEVYVTSWNTIMSKLVLRPPGANGTYQEFSNPAYTVVDDQDATGADLAVSGTVGQRVTWTPTAFTALAANEVLGAVKVTAALNRDASGPQNFNFMTRISTTDYNDSDQTLNITQTMRSKIWETSPATSVAWTVTELNAAQMGIRSRT
jgi:hypothetical protein